MKSARSEASHIDGWMSTQILGFMPSGHSMPTRWLARAYCWRKHQNSRFRYFSYQQGFYVGHL